MTKLEQEPVAWITKTGSVWKKKWDDSDIPLYTTPPQRTEQEQQIETLKRCLFQMQEAAKDLVEQAKSLTLPQRTWVGLTNEERSEIAGIHYARTNPLITATEAKLKEKNK